MLDDTTAASPRPRTYRAGWGWLLLCTFARFYLYLVGALAACAVLPMLFSLSGAVVKSGSMEPHIHAGDVVLSRALSPEAATPLGRVITFKAPSGSAYHGDVLHRLVAINSDGSLTTKGDANAHPDSAPLARRDIISTACLLIPWVGLPYFWVNSGAFWSLGIWVLITLVAVIVATADAAMPLQPRAPPDHTDPPSGSGPARESPADVATQKDTRTLGKPGGVTSSVVNRFGSVQRRAGVVATLLSTAGLALAPLGSAGAAFSATTGTIGNSWSTSGPATHLSFTSSPSTSSGGIPFSIQPVVAVQDAGGATVGVSSARVSLTITTPAGASLTCTSNPTTATAGIATFAGCRIDKAGTYTLTATSGSLTAALSTSVTITTGPASKLAFITHPSSSTGSVAFGTQPEVAVQDAGGNTITFNTTPVSLTITTPAGANLTCATNPKVAISGVASFAGCTIDKAGTYTLTATSSGLTSAVSASFTISVGAGPSLPLRPVRRVRPGGASS